MTSNAGILPTRRSIDEAVNAMLHKIADEAAAKAAEFGKSTTTAAKPEDDDDDDRPGLI